MFITIIFVVVIGIIIVQVVKGLLQWQHNNNSPILTVEAKVVTKRMAVNEHTSHRTMSHHHHHHHDHHHHHAPLHHHSTSTDYYATFEVESGDRMEFRIPDREYGLLAEGDTGRITFQGTRYKGFERTR